MRDFLSLRLPRTEPGNEKGGPLLVSRLPGALIVMAANSGWLLASTTIRLFVGFLTTVWLTRYLGPDGFGLYSYVIALVMIFASVASVGMLSLVTRELVEQPDAQHRILGSAMVIRVTGAVLAASALALFAFAFHPDLDRRVALLLFGLVLLIQPLEVVSLFYESRTQSRYIVWVELVASVAYLVVVAGFIVIGLDVRWFLIALLAQEVIVQVGALTVYAWHGYRPTRWRFDTSRARRMVGEGWPLILSALGAALYLRIDQVMLGQLSTAAQTGTYAAAARLSETWFVIPGLIVASAFPYLLRLRRADPDRYGWRLQQLYDLLAWLGISVAVSVTLAAPWLVGLLYGSAFADSATILQIHVWGGVFIAMRAAFSKWLIAERLLMFSVVSQGAGAVVNIALNLVLIPAFGGVGAAWATVISYATASYFALLIFPRTRPAAAMMTKTLGAPLRYLRMGIGSHA
jgi:O-antigen/teichoic acid export membrane protein